SRVFRARRRRDGASRGGLRVERLDSRARVDRSGGARRALLPVERSAIAASGLRLTQTDLAGAPLALVVQEERGEAECLEQRSPSSEECRAADPTECERRRDAIEWVLASLVREDPREQVRPCADSCDQQPLELD